MDYNFCIVCLCGYVYVGVFIEFVEVIVYGFEDFGYVVYFNENSMMFDVWNILIGCYFVDLCVIEYVLDDMIVVNIE